jgi:hypothetical protein
MSADVNTDLLKNSFKKVFGFNDFKYSFSLHKENRTNN